LLKIYLSFLYRFEADHVAREIKEDEIRKTIDEMEYGVKQQLEAERVLIYIFFKNLTF